MRQLFARLALMLGLTTDPEVEHPAEEEQVDIKEYIFLMHEPLIREYVEKNKLNTSKGGGSEKVQSR